MTDPTRSRALRVWSLCLALVAPVFGLVGLIWVVIALTPTGDNIGLESAYVPEHFAQIVVISVAVGMLIAALLLWVIAGVPGAADNRTRDREPAQRHPEDRK